jgi:hypothetical protein
MRLEPADEFAGPISDITGDDGHYQPPQLLECRRASAVPDECIGPAVPVDSVVLGRHAQVGPGKIEPPDTPPQVRDLSYWRTGGGNPPSIITRRASLSIGDSASGEAKPTNSRAVTTPRRPACRATAVASSSRVHVLLRSAASSVASARGRRSPRAISIAVHAGVVAGRPPHDGQRRTRASVYDQTVGRAQSPTAGIEHVQICAALGVEAVRSGSGIHACRYRGAGRQVDPTQSQRGGHSAAAVDATPNSLQLSGVQLSFQPTTTQECQRLGRSAHAALCVEQPAEL